MKSKSVCGRRYRVWLADEKWSGTRHCTKKEGHKGRCGKAKRAATGGKWANWESLPSLGDDGAYVGNLFGVEGKK